METIYAVFDTNVLVSALMTTRLDSPTVLLLDYVLDGRIVLLYNNEILSEYDEVLHRDKFDFGDERIQALINLVKTGLHLNRTECSEVFPDSDDRVFYQNDQTTTKTAKIKSIYDNKSKYSRKENEPLGKSISNGTGY